MCGVGQSGSFFAVHKHVWKVGESRLTWHFSNYMKVNLRVKLNLVWWAYWAVCLMCDCLCACLNVGCSVLLSSFAQKPVKILTKNTNQTVNRICQWFCFVLNTLNEDIGTSYLLILMSSKLTSILKNPLLDLKTKKTL